MARGKNPVPYLDTRKLKVGHKIVVDRTFGMAVNPDFEATVVEPTATNPVLEGVNPLRQMVVKPKGKHTNVTIDKAWITKRI